MAKMDKVLLFSITAGKLRVKCVSKQVQGREQDYVARSKGRAETAIDEAGSQTIFFSHNDQLS